MLLKIGELARLTGLTIRTLHHYDHIGLVVPSVRTPAGYRGYIDADIERLHLVLVYRSVGLPLDHASFDAPAGDGKFLPEADSTWKFPGAGTRGVDGADGRN